MPKLIGITLSGPLFGFWTKLWQFRARFFGNCNVAPNEDVTRLPDKTAYHGIAVMCGDRLCHDVPNVIVELTSLLKAYAIYLGLRNGRGACNRIHAHFQKGDRLVNSAG